MATFPTPTVANGDILTASHLNTLSANLDYLNGRGNSPLVPFLTYYWTATGDAFFIVRYRTGFPHLHYSYTNWGGVAGGMTFYMDKVTSIAIPVTQVYNNGSPAVATIAGSVDLSTPGLITLTNLDYYIIKVTYTKSGSSHARMNYLELRDVAA